MSFIQPIQIVRPDPECGSTCDGCTRRTCPRNIIKECKRLAVSLPFRRGRGETFDKAMARTIRTLAGTINYCRRMMPKCLFITYQQLFICGLEKAWDTFNAKVPDLVQQAYEKAYEGATEDLKVSRKAFTELNEAVETWNLYYRAYKSAIHHSTDHLALKVGFGPRRLIMEYIRGPYMENQK